MCIKKNKTKDDKSKLFTNSIWQVIFLILVVLWDFYNNKNSITINPLGEIIKIIPIAIVIRSNYLKLRGSQQDKSTKRTLHQIFVVQSIIIFISAIMLILLFSGVASIVNINNDNIIVVNGLNTISVSLYYLISAFLKISNCVAQLMIIYATKDK